MRVDTGANGYWGFPLKAGKAGEVRRCPDVRNICDILP